MGVQMAEKKKRRQFTKDFRAEAVRLVPETGKPVSEVARDIDVTETSLYAWVRQDRIDRGKGGAGELTREEQKSFAASERKCASFGWSEILKKNGGVLRVREEMKFAAILAQRVELNVSWKCRRLKVSRSGFYAWVKRKPSRCAVEDRRLSAKIVSSFRAKRAVYGSPRLVDELRADGESVGRRRVARLMKKAGLCARVPKRFRKTTYFRDVWSVGRWRITSGRTSPSLRAKWPYVIDDRRAG